MTSYPRTDEGRDWENILPVRKWLYQTPEQILIKASNGASDFGNKFGQPLSLMVLILTFEHEETTKICLRQGYHAGRWCRVTAHSATA